MTYIRFAQLIIADEYRTNPDVIREALDRGIQSIGEDVSHIEMPPELVGLMEPDLASGLGICAGHYQGHPVREVNATDIGCITILSQEREGNPDSDITIEPWSIECLKTTTSTTTKMPLLSRLYVKIKAFFLRML